MGQDELTGVLVTSICEKLPATVVSLLKADSEARDEHPLLQAFPYHVKTKYFTADIHLYACKDPTELSDEELSRFEALVVLFDSNCDNFKEKSEQLEQLRNRCTNSEVNLAVCELCENEQIKKIFNERLSEFELIETEAEEQDECGLDRMEEAIRMHTWSNLVMHEREKLPGNPKLPGHLFTGGTVPLDEEASASAEPEQEVPVNPESDISFEDLFEKFASLKSKAMTLQGEQRKKFAEDIVTQFWKAMGQDEEELANLDSDSE